MKTLVIHPFDLTTGFLEDIYYGKQYTVFNVENSSKGKLKQAINEHDKIIMLGHGSADGLFSSKQDRFIIDSDLVYLLREKILVGIWCYAVDFAHKYKLKGLFSGMIISEMDEAYLNNIEATEKEIHQQNTDFAKAIRDIEAFENKQSVLYFKQKYKGNSDVRNFNRERIYYI